MNTENQKNPMPAYVPDAQMQAQTQALKEVTGILNSSFPPAEEITDTEDARRQAAKEERKALDASKYQVDDKYIVNPEKDSVVVTRIKDGATLFMQGEDADIFLKDVDAIEDVELRNYAISQYDDVFEKVDAELTAEMESLHSAEDIVDGNGSLPIVIPSPESSYSGRVLGSSDQHVVISLGRSALIVEKKNIDRIPGVNEIVDLKFAGGKGVFAPVKAIDIGR